MKQYCIFNFTSFFILVLCTQRSNATVTLNLMLFNGPNRKSLWPFVFKSTPAVNMTTVTFVFCLPISNHGDLRVMQSEKGKNFLQRHQTNDVSCLCFSIYLGYVPATRHCTIAGGGAHSQMTIVRRACAPLSKRHKF